MGVLDLLFIGVGLSMDAFAVAICKGLAMPRLNMKQALVIACFFGAFQAIMPTLGWALGTQCASFVTSVSHWIAFVLLAFIGGKMLWEVFRSTNDTQSERPGNKNASIETSLYAELSDEAAPQPLASYPAVLHLDIKELFMLAIATSIDALAVGITFAFLHVNIIFSVSIIGITTFVISLAGVACGHAFGSRYERAAQIVGGVVLVAIGLKILLEGLGIL